MPRCILLPLRKGFFPKDYPKGCIHVYFHKYPKMLNYNECFKCGLETTHTHILVWGRNDFRKLSLLLPHHHR